MSEDPSTWLGLAEAYAADADTEIRQLSEILPSVLRQAPEDELPGPLEGVENGLGRLAVLRGRDACATPAAALTPIVDLAVARMDPRLSADGAAEMENLTYAVSLLNLLTVLRGTGYRPAGADDARAADWLGQISPELSRLNVQYQRRAACAAIGYDAAGLARRALDLEPVRDWPEVAPVRALADALAGRDAEAAWTAWLEYLWDFPANQPGRAAFGDLVSLGRTVHIILRGEPEPELTERIRRDLSL
jgi:hypothetical protein